MKTVTVINHFKLKPGKTEEFIATQKAFAGEIGKSFSGLVGGRMYCGLDGKTAVLVSVFESIEAQESLRTLPIFQAHVQKLRTLIEEANPAFYEIAYTTGNFLGFDVE